MTEYKHDNLKYPTFLESEIGIKLPNDVAFHVILVPYEKSESYGTGTVVAPSHILKASQQLELFDGASVPADHGIYTHPPVDCSGTHEEALDRISEIVSSVVIMDKIPIMIGGEHTVTNGALLALKERSGDVGIIQFDAHADLRDSYQDTPFSHACVMHRAMDLGFQILQIGVRSLSAEEHDLRDKNAAVNYWDASEIALKGIDTLIIPDSLPDTVYITFDVDALDTSLMPATGTPEPGGLNWYQTMDALQAITSRRKVIGFDVVELAPVNGLHHPDYTVARLLYNTMGFISRSPHFLIGNGGKKHFY